MKQLIIFLFSLLISTNSFGDPEGYTLLSTNELNVSEFINIPSILREGSTLRYWSIFNINNPENYLEGKHKSVKEYTELDCKVRTYKTLTRYIFLEHDAKGRGENIDTPDGRKPTYIIPGTLADLVRETLCK
tara:strand:+ start:57 stop:452 length:396 start_codon:yes stop_codon:yes gene_type:complete